MKIHSKFYVIFVYILILTSLTLAEEDKRYQDQAEVKLTDIQLDNTLIGFFIGNYNVSSRRFRQIYGKSGSIYGLDFTRIILTRNVHNFGLSIEARRFAKTGHSTITQDETKIILTPISIDTKYLIRIKSLIPFLGIGLDYYNYKEKSDIYNTNGSTLGFHIQGGLYYQIPLIKFLKLKIFTKLTRAMTKENNIEVNLGGYEFGISFIFGINLFNKLTL